MNLKITHAGNSTIYKVRFLTQDRKKIPHKEHTSNPGNLIKNTETATTFIYDLDSDYFLKGRMEYTESNVPTHNGLADHFISRGIKIKNYVSGVIENIDNKKAVTLAFNNRNLSQISIDNSLIIKTTLKIIFAMNSKNFGKNIKFPNDTQISVFLREPNNTVNTIFKGTFKEFVEKHIAKGYKIEKIKNENT
jgi:hypothetical protein